MPNTLENQIASYEALRGRTPCALPATLDEGTIAYCSCGVTKEGSEFGGYDGFASQRISKEMLAMFFPGVVLASVRGAIVNKKTGFIRAISVDDFNGHEDEKVWYFIGDVGRDGTKTV